MVRDLTRVPVSLAEAEALLLERFPEYAFTARQLRQMVQTGAVPCVQVRRPLPHRGCGRPVSLLVRVADLVQRFRSWERN